jgi:hypothetical protein
MKKCKVQSQSQKISHSCVPLRSFSDDVLHRLDAKFPVLRGETLIPVLLYLIVPALCRSGTHSQCQVLQLFFLTSLSTGSESGPAWSMPFIPFLQTAVFPLDIRWRPQAFGSHRLSSFLRDVCVQLCAVIDGEGVCDVGLLWLHAAANHYVYKQIDVQNIDTLIWTLYMQWCVYTKWVNKK